MNIDVSQIKKVFFIGIGGIGISAVARMMLLEGKEVHGSDMSESNITLELRKAGAKIEIGQRFDLIPSDVDLIIYTIAIIHYDANLYEQVKNSGIPARSYPEMLKIISQEKFTIAISGTHGKTTTTGMIAKVALDAELDPTVIIGSLMKDTGSNFVAGKSNYFIVEACEYERSFLNLHPNILVITNIEADHLDYYKDIADIQNAFKQLIAQTDPDGFIICDPHAPNMKEVLVDAKATIVDYRALIDLLPKLSVPGEHNRLDAAAAKAVANVLSIPQEKSDEALKTFEGTWRRLEKRGTTANGTLVYDDYAHHPTEARASLSALRELYPRGEKTITVLFQPHLYSRTKALFNDFITAFDDADNVLFLPIYFAREDPDPEVSSEKLADAVRLSRGEAIAFASFDEAEAHLKKMNLGAEDVLVTMGAGEAYKIGDELLKK